MQYFLSLIPIFHMIVKSNHDLYAFFIGLVIILVEVWDGKRKKTIITIDKSDS